MKKNTLIVMLLAFVAVKTFAQSGPVFNFSKTPGFDTLLTGWKIMPGDNPQYAKPGFDDSKWPAFDPSLAITSQNIKGDISWLRLRVRIDTALNTTDFGLMSYQSVTSEIYVDGSLFKTYGSLSAQTEVYNPLDFPEPIRLAPGLHVIAIKIRVQKALLNLRAQGYDLCILKMRINRYTDAVANYNDTNAPAKRESTENLMLMGVFFILTITHFVFFRYYRKQRAHLYYGMVTLILLFDTYLNIAFISIHSLLTYYWLNILGNLSFVGFIFLPLTIYAFFGYTKRIYLKIVLILSTLALAISIIVANYDESLIFIFIPLLNAAECIRAGIWARRQHKSGALFVVAGSSLFLVLLVTQTFITDSSNGDLLFVLAMLCLPIGMTVFLAIETALTYRSLEVKLVEVQELSQKNLEYQVEKQELLASQNEMLEQQVTERTAELNQSLNNLRSAQQQLIQSEKMASLGELTAGIAHEIQNPLNFVNNFSDVNREMLEELKAESEKPEAERDGELETELISDLIENEQKINHHGKRADAIVKGMLEHSRASTGAKEPTSLNALADECMRLAYHGLRAKDKSFNSEIVTNLDETLPPVNVIPQDMVRVMLNLFNNAFYAVNQKQKTAADGYKPEVSLTTLSEKDRVIISVKDNGIGIPDVIKEKIMQPFFTTKPTGEGTGLGLSLSYDMVVNGHGGSIQVNSIEGEGSEFIILLPGN